MFISYSTDHIIRAVSDRPIHGTNAHLIETKDLDSYDKKNLIGKPIAFGPKAGRKLRIAVICNWGDKCGIATYTQMLVEALRAKSSEVKIFAEYIDGNTSNDERENVVRNWRRGESMIPAMEEILAWEPDIVHVQHEFGIFPKATHFLKLLELLARTPYVVTTHSVYEHLDKTVCTACIKNVIVHSEIAKRVYGKIGHINNTYVIPHGCIVAEDHSELWNIFHNDHAIIQFGFGFNYKGVDKAIDALNYLRKQDKFKNVFYCYLCSENPHTRSVHEEYHSYLKKKVREYGMQENVVILRGFLSEKSLTNFLRTAKLALFPYSNDPTNCVYGASGAIRLAMACGTPIVASDSHLFDDLDGVIPRPTDYLSLATEIDKIFSDQDYREKLVNQNLQFVRENDWSITADRHLSCYDEIIGDFNSKMIRVETYTKIGIPQPNLTS